MGLSVRFGEDSTMTPDPASFELRGNAEDRKDQFLKIRGGINQRLGNRAKASARPFKVAGDNE